MQITSFYIFNISKNRQYSALVKMAYAGFFLRKANGCTFAKIMGSGGGLFGFGLSPNFRMYAAIMVWDNIESMLRFEKTSRIFTKYNRISDSINKIYGSAYQAHGTWNGIEPFQVQQPSLQENAPIIVLTRARIKWSQIRNFWRSVPKASEALNGIKGKMFSVGIGEFPLFLQATLSIWESQEHMREYAYKNPEHLAAIRRTRELKWYAEELFARFYLLNINASEHEGKDR